ncbi:MAG: hypothetical protein IJ799_03845 [Bacteroidales bacterium]|nr:hypothetical protein [Bacteroidales bacterium]
MDRFGLIGHPIDHSLSPELFRLAYGGKYAYDLIGGADFEASWKRFLDGYKAINITTPFKEAAFAKVSAFEAEGRGFVSDECRKTGATNLCVKTSRGVECYNSDYRGVKAMLAERGYGQGSSVLVVGCGGAGMAAAAAAGDLGADTVVCNRSASKYPGARPLEELPLLASVCDIVIYTLPVAVPQLAEMRDPGFGCAMCSPVILEANYRNPCLEGAFTGYIGGREWLLAQAVTGYRLMTGEDPDSEAMKSAFI